MTKEEFKEMLKEVINEKVMYLLEDNNEWIDHLQNLIYPIVEQKIKDCLINDSFRQDFWKLVEKNVNTDENRERANNKLNKELEGFNFNVLITQFFRNFIEENKEFVMDFIKDQLEKIRIKDEVLYKSIIDRLIGRG